VRHDELPLVDVLLLERREDAEALAGLVAGGRDVDEVAVAAAGERLFDDAGTGDEHTWAVMGGHVTAAFVFGDFGEVHLLATRATSSDRRMPQVRRLIESRAGGIHAVYVTSE
jgi:hypothetical protein